MTVHNERRNLEQSEAHKDQDHGVHDVSVGSQTITKLHDGVSFSYVGISRHVRLGHLGQEFSKTFFTTLRVLSFKIIEESFLILVDLVIIVLDFLQPLLMNLQ